VSYAFVDTSVWLAYFNRRDRWHARARQLVSPDYRLLTTWPVVWESVTLLSQRLSAVLAVDAGMLLTEGNLAHIIEISSEDIGLAWSLMRQYAERRLSAADATSFAVVRRRKILTAMSFDADFGVVLNDRTVLGASEG
jgi:uncharacterized protein